MKHKNGIPGKSPYISLPASSNEEITPGFSTKGMTLVEFIANIIGAALCLAVIWLYTVAFTLLFAPGE